MSNISKTRSGRRYREITGGATGATKVWNAIFKKNVKEQVLAEIAKEVDRSCKLAKAYYAWAVCYGDAKACPAEMPKALKDLYDKSTPEEKAHLEVQTQRLLKFGADQKEAEDKKAQSKSPLTRQAVTLPASTPVVPAQPAVVQTPATIAAPAPSTPQVPPPPAIVTQSAEVPATTTVPVASTPVLGGWQIQTRRSKRNNRW